MEGSRIPPLKNVSVKLRSLVALSANVRLSGHLSTATVSSGVRLSIKDIPSRRGTSSTVRPMKGLNIFRGTWKSNILHLPHMGTRTSKRLAQSLTSSSESPANHTREILRGHAPERASHIFTNSRLRSKRAADDPGFEKLTLGGTIWRDAHTSGVANDIRRHSLHTRPRRTGASEACITEL